MSIGLAFVQGLVGGFQKNIEREQTLRTADDQRLAGLQDTLFKATAEAAAKGNPVPNQLGDMLRKAKEDVGKRPDIGLFGTGKAERLNLDFTGLASTVNNVDGSYFELGSLRIPMNPLYAKEKDVFTRSYHFLTGINKYASNPEQLAKMKKELENESTAKYFNGVLRTQKGLYKALLGPKVTPRGATKITGVPQVGTPQGQFINLGEFDYLKDVDLDDTEQDIAVAKDRLFGKEGTGLFAKNRKKSVLFPYLTSEKETQYVPFELEPSDMESIKRIALLNGENDPSVFISKYRKSIGKISPTADTTADRLKIQDEIKKFFPSIFHAIELEKRGGALPLTQMSKSQRENIIKYLDDNIGYNIGDRVRALSPLMKLEKNQKLSLVGGIEGFIFEDEQNKDDFFSKATGVKLSDFIKQYESNQDTVRQLDKLMSVESKIISTPGGLARFLQQTFGSITVETGVIDQVANIFSSGPKREDVTEESLFEIVKRVKDGKGIASELSSMSKSESIMIALAANMARAVDPAGRLSNQDFEVQLRRLGASGFFKAKTSQIVQLQDVMEDFKGRLERIEMIKRVVDGAATRNFNEQDFKILNANAILNNLMEGQQAGKDLNLGSSGLPPFNNENSWSVPNVVGPNNNPIKVYEDPNGNQRYFEDDGNGNLIEINEDELRNLDEQSSNQTGDKKFNMDKFSEGLKNQQEIKQVDKNNNEETVTSEDSLVIVEGNNTTGIILGDRQPDGTIKKRPGKYRQNTKTFKFDRIN